MGKAQSKETEEAQTDGASTMTRAIARGRVYLVIRYPKSAEEFDGETMFTDDQFRYLMLELQKVSMKCANNAKLDGIISRATYSTYTDTYTHPRGLLSVMNILKSDE